MTDILKRATAISSILSGIYSGIGFIIIMYVKNHYNLDTAYWNQFVGIASLIFFLFPLVIFVVGLEFMIDRFKNITPAFFIFPSSENDLKAFGRMLLWFMITAAIFLSFGGLANF